MINVVKVGGAVVEDSFQLAVFLDGFSQLRGENILVHGGGRSATAMATQLGLPTTMIEGRRVTDADMLRVVEMVYGGLVNKTIVAQCQARGVDAVGLTGADMDIIRAVKERADVKRTDDGFHFRFILKDHFQLIIDFFVGCPG